MSRCPFAQWRPLGPIQPPSMSRHDLLIYHTVGGNSLGGTDAQFHAGGYSGTESHFGVGGDGIIYQWVDTDHIADASLDANRRAISVETADAGGGFPKWTGSNVPAWTDAQLDALVRLGIWVCDTHNIPKVMVPDSGSTRRGIAGHRQGIDSSPAGQPGYRKPGTEHWSTALGKVCPGDRRFAQLKAVVVPAILEGDTMSAAEVAQIIAAVEANGTHAGFPSRRLDPATGKPYDPPRLVQAGTFLSVIDDTLADLAAGLTPAAIADAVIAKLPPANTGGLTKQDVVDALTQVLVNGTGGTS